MKLNITEFHGIIHHLFSIWFIGSFFETITFIGRYCFCSFISLLEGNDCIVLFLCIHQQDLQVTFHFQCIFPLVVAECCGQKQYIPSYSPPTEDASSVPPVSPSSTRIRHNLDPSCYDFKIFFFISSPSEGELARSMATNAILVTYHLFIIRIILPQQLHRVCFQNFSLVETLDVVTIKSAVGVQIEPFSGSHLSSF